MDELRCPMCGKPNPKELDICQYCQARLRPVWDSNDRSPVSPPDASGQEPGDSLPDWLSSLRSQNDEEAMPFEESEEALPDWLRTGDEPGDAAQNAEPDSWIEDPGSTDLGSQDPGELSPIAEDGVPDWLQSLRYANDEAPEPAAEEPEPDWLALSAGPDADRAGDDLGGNPEESKDVFSEPGLEVDPEPQESEDAALPEDTTGLNWIPDKPSFVENLPAAGLPFEDIPGAENDDDLEEVDLSWLDALEANAPDLDIETPSETAETASDVAPFLQESEAEHSDVESLLNSELPDWLSPAAADEGDAGEVEEALPEDTGLIQADLPNWLKAMRPAGNDLAPEGSVEGASTIEGVGPLSGLRGVLPAEVGISPISRPPAYSNKLQITDTQQAHVDMLKALLQAEGQPRPLPRRSVITPQHLLRIAIFAVLVVVVGLPLIVGFPGAVAPTPQVEASEIFEQIDRLPPAAPVLLVFDYQPGLSGEMEAALSPLVDHLMLKGTYLATVSTSATGPLQAERLLKMVNDSGSHAYRTIEQYANLGYIPGGAFGLQAFAQNPRQVTRLANNANTQGPALSAWQAAPMQDLNTLDDFSMIVVASDDPDTVRTWVEQVEPYLVDAPLLAVVSAQAEPLVRPYYQSRQVDGLLAGLPGGASYAGATGRLGDAHTYWPSFSLAVLAAALLIVVGGSLNAISGVIARRRETAKGRA